MKKAIKITAFVLAGVLIICSIFLVRACSAPPEYSEIKARVEYLINASRDVNDVVWGEGLETYERVYDPTREIYKTDKKYTNSKGEEKDLEYYYYRTLDTDRIVYAYKPSHETSTPYSYAYVSLQPLNAEALKVLFPKAEEHAENELYYTLLSSADSKYVYLVPYTETKPDFCYKVSDPENYDYVVLDSEYNTVDKIKAYIRTVYADDYAASIDSTLFDGVTIQEGAIVSLPRYSTNFNYEFGGNLLTKLNTYEPKFEERRVYKFETARIDRNSSNSEEVLVEIDSYLPSKPKTIVVAKIYFTLQNGVWYLSSPTY